MRSKEVERNVEVDGLVVDRYANNFYCGPPPRSRHSDEDIQTVSTSSLHQDQLKSYIKKQVQQRLRQAKHWIHPHKCIKD